LANCGYDYATETLKPLLSKVMGDSWTMKPADLKWKEKGVLKKYD